MQKEVYDFEVDDVTHLLESSASHMTGHMTLFDASFGSHVGFHSWHIFKGPALCGAKTKSFPTFCPARLQRRSSRLWSLAFFLFSIKMTTTWHSLLFDSEETLPLLLLRRSSRLFPRFYFFLFQIRDVETPRLDRSLP